MDDTPPATATSRPAAITRWPAVVTVLGMAAWPYIGLLAANVGEPLDLAAVARWWLLATLPALAVTLLALRRSTTTGRRVGAWLGVALWLLHSHPLLSGLGASLGWEADPVVRWSVVALLVAGGALVAVRALAVQQFILAVAVLMALGSVLQLAVGIADRPAVAVAAEPAPTSASFVTRPDVWFIALDGLASDAWLTEELGYDADEFETALEADGFQIQRAATSNYPLTHLSISSTLMMEYGFEGVEEPRQRFYFDRMRGENATVDLMEANGYAYVHTYPGFWGGSRCSGREDLCLGRSGAVTDTDAALRAMVPFGAALNASADHTDIAEMNDPAAVVERVLDAQVASPAFHLVHVLNPHAPLLRRADCSVRTDIELRFSAWGDGPEYADAVRCLHTQLTTAVDRILAEQPDALIVIQGDHGPRLGIDWDVPDGVLLDQEMHFSILSTIRLPSACDGMVVPDDLTPVNTFRIARACLEGTDPELLPDRRFPIHAVRD